MAKIAIAERMLPNSGYFTYQDALKFSEMETNVNRLRIKTKDQRPWGSAPNPVNF